MQAVEIRRAKRAFQSHHPATRQCAQGVDQQNNGQVQQQTYEQLWLGAWTAATGLQSYVLTAFGGLAILNGLEHVFKSFRVAKLRRNVRTGVGLGMINVVA